MIMARAVLSGIFAVACATASRAYQDAATPAQRVLQQMAEVYSSCRSYRDTGTVTDQFGANANGFGGPAFTKTTKFNTLFVRPNQFRFEFTTTSETPALKGFPKMPAFTGFDNHFVTWQNKGRVYMWWTVQPEVQTEESLDMSIAGATGISDSSAHNVPRLLIPN